MFRLKHRRINLPLPAWLARRRPRLTGSGGGHSPLSESDRLANLSFVLHQPSTSLDVIAAAKSVRRNHHLPRDPEIVCDGDPGIPVDLWLAPSVGLPDAIAMHVSSPVLHIDRGEEPVNHIEFFRAPARLSIPADNGGLVGVAALVRRPGNRSLQLIARGPYRLSDGLDDAIRALETIIQSHVEQWQPGVRLWEDSAEHMLPELASGVS